MTIRSNADIARLYQDNMLSSRAVQVKNGYEEDFQALLANTLGNERNRPIR